MRRAQVRVVDNQQEETTSKEVTGSEAEALLRKYYQQQNQQQIDAYDNAEQDNFRGFQGIEVPPQRPHDPRVDADKDGLYHNTSWDGDQESGINFEIKVTSDMPLPKR